ncbi:restriction endonuclease subunit S [Irregularibacter muris]|uniref:Restriction endonuclease subunit S n=1 Tax=Irregularibacter muris TaxID=1796619 RepID=A0AAE3HER0_9FIRM|nr:restriction endonuclease subunit S [Irregularibacter muris]MCR1899170.1 restriction endonuclease subunit S [Irregularibacter muris]
MGLIKYTLGDLLELVTDANTELKYGPDDVKGMTITKQIIPTKADVSNADLSKFLIVNPDEFVFNPRTHGKKIGFGYNDTDAPFIISWNNIAFRIKSEMKKVILSEYLFLHFNREEWDREACYRSWGSSTEVFSWEALCEMELNLPPLPIQQKYVDIYNAMLANQRVYETGLEDLKLTCEIEINKIKHTAKKIPTGKLLENVDVRNADGAITSVQGINITKNFMPSVASVAEGSLKNYKVVKKGQFVYSSMQTGRDECIRIALLQEDEPIIVSPAYSVLQVKNDDVLAEYIMMWFSRSESDRYGWFASDGSIRANLDLDRFYEIDVPVPDIKIQEAIVEIYNAYLMRREINEKLKAQIKDLCPILIKGSLEEANT